MTVEAEPLAAESLAASEAPLAAVEAPLAAMVAPLQAPVTLVASIPAGSVAVDAL